MDRLHLTSFWLPVYRVCTSPGVLVALACGVVLVSALVSALSGDGVWLARSGAPLALTAQLSTGHPRRRLCFGTLLWAYGDVLG